jgi:metallo-beta-lactamase family protein
MAISATQIFRSHSDCLHPGLRAELQKGHDPFDLPGLRVTRQVAESKALNRITGGAVILAGSGMCTGGRVLHHLERNLPQSGSSVVFVGFAAPGTLARQIIDGARTVSIFGQQVSVRARIHTINGFSAHAGQDELLKWYASTGRPRATFLVHGDSGCGLAAMTTHLAGIGRNVVCPAMHQAVVLD